MAAASTNREWWHTSIGARRTLHGSFRKSTEAAALAQALDLATFVPLKPAANRVSGLCDYSGGKVFVKVQRERPAGRLLRALPGSPGLAKAVALVREAEALVAARAAGVRCPRVLSLFRSGRVWVLVCELVEGESLQSRYLAAPFELELPRECWKSLAGSIGALHHAGWEHRDLHHGNVMVDAAAGTATLVDFSAARPMTKAQRADASECGLDDLIELGVSLHAKVPKAALRHFVRDWLAARGIEGEGATTACIEAARERYFEHSSKVITDQRRKLSGTRRGRAHGCRVLVHKHFEFALGALETLSGEGEALQRAAAALANAAERGCAYPVTVSVREAKRTGEGAGDAEAIWGALLARWRGLPHGPYPVALVSRDDRHLLVSARHVAFASAKLDSGRTDECRQRLKKHGLVVQIDASATGFEVLVNDQGQTAWLWSEGEQLV